MIESVASWFTPAVFFCFLNLMIGTIFITSSLRTDKTKQQPQFTRNPSLLHRVKSFNFSFPDTYNSDYSPQLDRSPSLLQRVKSINLSFSRLERNIPKDCDRSTPSQVREFSTGVCDADPIPSVAKYDEEQVQKVDDIEPQIMVANQEDSGSHVTRSKSATCPATVKVPTRRMMVKSASEKKMPVPAVEEVADLQRPATTRETVYLSGEEEAVDKKADDFINKFRQQLKLQRLDSILRYKEMLNRGLGR